MRVVANRVGSVIIFTVGMLFLGASGEWWKDVLFILDACSDLYLGVEGTLVAIVDHDVLCKFHGIRLS